MFFGEKRQDSREQWTNEEMEAAIEGKGRVAGLRLSLLEREKFENAKQRGYVLGRRYSRVALVFRFWCRIRRQAYVYVERERSYATVAMEIFESELGLSLLWQEKLLRVFDYVAKSSSTVIVEAEACSITNIEAAQGEFVAQAMVAIFQLSQGKEAPLPPFPEPNLLVQAVTEAKTKRMIVTHVAGDPLTVRWLYFCQAYRWPYIRVHKVREKHVLVELILPDGVILTADEDTYLLSLLRDAGVVREDPRKPALSAAQLFVQVKGGRALRLTLPPVQGFQVIEQIMVMLEAGRHFTWVPKWP